MVIVAIDPGLTSGWCSLSGGVFAAGEVDFHTLCDFMYIQCSERADDDLTVVCERFIITPRTGQLTQAPWSLEIIGVLRWLCYRYHHLFVLQGAGDAKSLATNALLQEQGWWSPGLGHANDAARHLLLYQVRQGAISLIS